MKKTMLTHMAVWMVCLLASALFAGTGVRAYDTSDLTIPASAQKIVYGQSGAGRDLTAYRFGTGRNVMVVGFSIHGYEDNWAKDGGALVYAAGQLMQSLDQNMWRVQDYGWSVYVLPCMNPDGLIDGYTNNGPGRCTTTYLSGGELVSGGIDMNRSFPTAWTPYSGNRNFNGSAPLASRESAALARFVQQVKGSGSNICIDAHGWFSQIITSNGYSTLYNIFKERFPGNSWANCNSGAGYFTAYTASLGYASCLFEFPDGLTSLTGFQNSGYSERFINCILDLTEAYGSYDPHGDSCPARNFTDVNRSSWDWYHPALDYMLEQGIFNGMSDTSFAPDAAMSRAMLVKTLWAMAGSPTVELPPKQEDAPPADGDDKEPSVDASEETKEIKETEETKEPENTEDTQTPEDTPEPGDTTPPEDTDPSEDTDPPQEPEPPEEETNYQFTDVPEDAWYTQAVYWAQETGVVKGYPDGTFLPDKDVSRQEMAEFLYRFASWSGEDISAAAELTSFTDSSQVAQWAVNAMSWACGQGLINGMTETTLAPEGNATRAQVATILTRYLQGGEQTSRTLAAGPIPYMEPIYYGEGPELNGN